MVTRPPFEDLSKNQLALKGIRAIKKAKNIEIRIIFLFIYASASEVERTKVLSHSP